MTRNANSWLPGMDGDYILGLIEFPEYSGIRMVGMMEGFTNEPRIGDHVGFEFRRAFETMHRIVFVPWSRP